MTDFVSEGLVFFKIDEEVLFKVLKIVGFDFCYVFFDVWERISDIFLAPASCVEKYVNDGLFFDQHLVGFVCNPFGDSAGLTVVYTVWWWLPIILDGCPMRISNENTASVRSLHRVSQKSCHVQISWHLEDVTEILIGGR